jgi:hypothetical protein
MMLINYKLIQINFIHSFIHSFIHVKRDTN